MNLRATICALLLAFAACASAKGSAEQQIKPAPGYSSYRVDNTAGGRRWQSRLSFSPDVMSFDGSSQPGARLIYEETAQARYLVGLPLSVPKSKRKSWSYGGFNCAAVYARNDISMICLKVDTGARFSSFYTPGQGILWFDFYCAPNTNEVCRYRLDKGRGLFSTT